jgi:hypothetical protein
MEVVALGEAAPEEEIALITHLSHQRLVWAALLITVLYSK